MRVGARGACSHDDDPASESGVLLKDGCAHRVFLADGVSVS